MKNKLADARSEVLSGGDNLPDRLSNLSNEKLVRSDYLGPDDGSISGCNEVRWVSEELLYQQLSNEGRLGSVSQESVFGDYRFPRFDSSDVQDDDNLSND